MKEELINKFFEQLLEFTKRAGDEVPKYAEELLKYGEVHSYVMIALCTLSAVFFLSLFIYSVYRLLDSEVVGSLVLVSLIIFMFSIWGALSSSMKLVKIKTAPRVYIIEQLRGGR